jgi:hypothetical protein
MVRVGKHAVHVLETHPGIPALDPSRASALSMMFASTDVPNVNFLVFHGLKPYWHNIS